MKRSMKASMINSSTIRAKRCQHGEHSQPNIRSRHLAFSHSFFEIPLSLVKPGKTTRNFTLFFRSYKIIHSSYFISSARKTVFFFCCCCFCCCLFFVPVPLEWVSLTMFNNIILFVTKLKVKHRSKLKTCTYFCVFQRHGQSSPSEPAHLKIRTISYCNKILVPFHSLYLTILIYL